jgi:hypothetical protein
MEPIWKPAAPAVMAVTFFTNNAEHPVLHALDIWILPGRPRRDRAITNPSDNEALHADGNKEQTAKADAAEFLNDVLANGPVKVTDIEKEARAACLLGADPKIGQSKPFRSGRKALECAVPTQRTEGVLAITKWTKSAVRKIIWARVSERLFDAQRQR